MDLECIFTYNLRVYNVAACAASVPLVAYHFPKSIMTLSFFFFFFFGWFFDLSLIFIVFNFAIPFDGILSRVKNQMWKEMYFYISIR